MPVLSFIPLQKRGGYELSGSVTWSKKVHHCFPEMLLLLLNFTLDSSSREVPLKTLFSWTQFSANAICFSSKHRKIVKQRSTFYCNQKQRLHGNGPVIVWFCWKDSIQMIQVTCVNCSVKFRPAHQRKSHAQCGPNVIRHCRHRASWPNCTLGKKKKERERSGADILWRIHNVFPKNRKLEYFEKIESS